MKIWPYQFRGIVHSLIAVVGLVGCAPKNQIQVYTIPAEPTPPESWDLASAFGPEKVRFSIKDANGTASVTMTVLQGDGGGLLENMNRWRGQLGLEKLEEKNLAGAMEQLKGLGKEAHMIDISGISQRTQDETRLIGVIAPGNELTWFYKLMGSASVVEESKGEFLEYLPHWR